MDWIIPSIILYVAMGIGAWVFIPMTVRDMIQEVKAALNEEE